MNFSQYKEFRQRLELDFGEYYKKYPDAFLVLDFIAQMVVYENISPGGKYADRFYYDMYIDTFLNSRYLTGLYRLYLGLISFLLRPRKKKFTIHNSIPDSKFYGLKKIISNVALKNNWRILTQGDISSDIFSYLLLKKISPYNCFVGEKTKKLLSEIRGPKEVFLEKINDHKFMNKLNDAVSEDVKWTAKLTKRLGIDLFINTGDSSGHARILIDSSKYHPNKTISFSHGYFKEYTLMGVAPVRSSKLILWTDGQKKDVLEAIGTDEEKKLSTIGFPKDLRSKNEKSKEVTSLLLMGLILPIIKSDKARSDFIKSIQLINNFSDRIKIRLHPHERRPINEIEIFIKQNDLVISDDDLPFDIASADYIFGANTSTLVEAASTGRHVFVFEELTKPNLSYEGTIPVKHQDLKDIINFDSNIEIDETILFNQQVSEDKFELLIFSMYPELKQ